MVVVTINILAKHLLSSEEPLPVARSVLLLPGELVESGEAKRTTIRSRNVLTEKINVFSLLLNHIYFIAEFLIEFFWAWLMIGYNEEFGQPPPGLHLCWLPVEFPFY